MLSGIKKFSIGAILFFVLATTVGGSFVLVESAKAQMAVTVAADAPATSKSILDEIFDGLKAAVLNAVVRVVAYGIRKISYDGAVWLASGGKGQTPFAHTKNFGDYLQNVGDEAFGVALESVSRDMKLGNICKIPDIKVDLNLKIGLRTNLGPIGGANGSPAKPGCSFTDFKKNWLNGDAWKSQYTGEALTKRFNATLTVDDSDLGIQLATTEKINNQVAQQKAGASLQRQEGAGFIAKTSAVSGNIQTPAKLQEEGFKATTPDKKQAKDEQQLEALLASGNIKVIPTVLTIFLGNLVDAMTRNFQEKGVLPFGICVGDFGGDDCKNSGNFASDYGSAGSLGGRQAAEALFSELLTVKIGSVDEYGILGQLNNCPDSPGLYNCRADSGLVQAAQSADGGTPMTIREALSKGWLHDWRLLPPKRVVENMDKNCYNSAYCYTNIKVLRQARILPLGFEIAAQESDPDRPWTLKQVMDGFNDCDYLKNNKNEIIGIRYDPVNKPFCHLIDPNWVLKVPTSRCSALVYGPTPLTSGVPDRLQECADLTSCVAYNSDGTCKNFAYCTREKNSWKFDADTCDSQFRTCRSFRDAEGKDVAYLHRTLDTGSCSQDNVGCAAYSLNQDENGQWQSVTAPAAPGFENTGVHFNNKISSSCSANSAGCTAFQVASAANDLLYLRQAPSYLKCYDSDPATTAVDWPETTADLSKIQPKPECKNYAAACIPDEASCSFYTPLSGSGGTARIPGRYTPATKDAWNDQCSAKCVGYAAYREMPSNYSNGQSVAYVIPSSGTKCTAAEEGCASFTNLSTATGGVEQVEHYSYLRTCESPARNAGKNFITYEGSKVGGFQLKTYRLVENTDSQNGPLGAPMYFYKTEDELKQYNDDCTADRYKAGTASLDCRQFNDEKGTVYYRLLAQTIPVSESCTPYRLNSPELYPAPAITNKTTCENDRKGLWQNNQCQVCFQNGEYKNGFCFYYGLPQGVQNTAGISRSCSASVDTCRAYKGNAGNNVKEIFNDTFETVPATAALQGWTNTALISPESTRVGEHSLEYNASGAGTVTKDVSLVIGKSYDLTFWAKGSIGNLTVSLKAGSLSKDFGAVGAGDTWNYYHLGPVEWAGANGAGQLSFKAQNNGKLFLDNVRLVEVADYVYLVKKSLKVDAVCDSTPNDNLPGEALGCSAYKDSGNNTIYLKNFSFLCRAEAVGCTALQDTQNTVADSDARAYNVRLTGGGGQKITRQVGADKYSCQIPNGDTGCYVDITGHTAEEINGVSGISIVASTVYVPPDTATSSPVYLVASKEATCNQVDAGCTYAGLEKKVANTSVFSTVLIKNNPDDADYSNALCTREAVGCNSYTDSGGALYFKDPAVVGQKVCTYKTGVGTNKSSGWFWKGVGVCSNNQANYCSGDADCGTGNKCEKIGDQACYPEYQQAGNSFGLWSYGDTGKYENFVGECPVKQDKCTEFIDHNDNEQAYYLIKDNKISSGNCSGEVSQKDGCALFDQTDMPTKYWSAADTYAASLKLDSKRVTPVVGDASKRDSNVIIKVRQDRTCGEWLQCRSSHRVWDEKNAKFKNVCDQVGRCDKSPESLNDGGITNCANWVGGNTEYSGQILTPELYTSRDISWKGMDFSGFSIPGIFPIEELTQVNTVVSSTNPDYRLVKMVPCGKNCAPTVTDPATEVACAPGKVFDEECTALAYVNGASIEDCRLPPLSCGKDDEGVCLAGVCIQKADGTKQDIEETAPRQICRAYPEKDSPFPYTPFVANQAQRFDGVHLCNESSIPSALRELGYSCECDYTRVKYGDAFAKFWNYELPNRVSGLPISNGGNDGGKTQAGQIPPGICQGGTQDGKSCRADSDCGYTDKTSNQFITDGSCQKNKKEFKYLGWRGFCVEEDLSRTINGDQNQHPCLTWYPVDSLAGALDINNQHPEAGYVPSSQGGRYFCLQSNRSVFSGQPVADKSKLTYTMRSLSFGSNDPPNQYGAPTKTQKWTEAEYGLACSGNVLLCGSKDIKDTQFSRSYFPASGEELLVTQPDIETVLFSVAPDLQSRSSKHDPPVNTIFEVWPNKLTDAGNFQAMYTVGPNGGNPIPPGDRRTITGQFLSKDNEFILLYSDGSFLKNDTTFQYPNGPSGLHGRILSASGLDAGPQHLDDLNSIWDASVPPDAICPASGDAGRWHAIRLQFDKTTRKLKGYYTAYCNNWHGLDSTVFHNGSLVLDGAVNYSVAFRMRQWCAAVAETTITNALSTDAVAWTDRLWKGPKKLAVDSVYNKSTPNLSLNYVFDTQFAPFGSLEYTSPPDRTAIVLSPSVTPVDDTGCSPNTECKYDPKVKIKELSENRVGAPYSCLDANGQAGACKRSEANGTTLNLVDTPAGKNVLGNAKGSLGQLFARVKQVLGFNLSQNRYDTSQSQYNLPDLTEIGDANGAKPTPPKIFPVGQCQTQDKCIEDQSRGEGISVNDVSSGNVKVSASAVSIRFFAFADKNQMPLKSIKVDWGDEINGPQEFTGLFRNHRGYLGTEAQCVDESQAQNFGQIVDKSCDNTYFRFDHVYDCNAKSPAWATDQTVCVQNGFDSGCCVYKPAVQVKDSWGWCSGSCSNHNGVIGCYDSEFANQCITSKARVEFNGSVIVAPR